MKYKHYFGLVFLFFCLVGFVKTDETNSKVIDHILKIQDVHILSKLLSTLLWNDIRMKCIVIVCEENYCDYFTNEIFQKFDVKISYFMIKTDKLENSTMLYNRTKNILNEIKIQACEFSVMLMNNGTKLVDFLHVGHKYRMINMRSNFILMHDKRLYKKEALFLWKIIINVIFIKKHYNNRTSELWYDVSTVPFPYKIKNFLVPRRISIWKNNKFSPGLNFFIDKTVNLKNQTIRAVTFEHVPATVKINSSTQRSRSHISSGLFQFAGVEIEILNTLSKAMNFIPNIYEAPDADDEKWGRYNNGTFTGLIGEMINFKADVALGDLYYSPYHLDLMDLTIPYNTECLSFLTPESLTDNSWKTLLLPFELFLWLPILFALFSLGFIFHLLSKFYYYVYEHYETSHLTSPVNQYSDVKKIQLHISYYDLMKNSKRRYYKPRGLYIFGEIINSILYSYGMLLLISLPRFPSGWSLRMLTGWYSLYCSLITVSYRASMTAILAKPAHRITIDTLQQLQYSGLKFGGWGENVKDFFETLSDTAGKKIAEKFEQVTDIDEAISRIAKGEFAYYENTLCLKTAAVKRQLDSNRLELRSGLNNESNYINSDRTLHIMRDCIIVMPISIGLQKNSPLKPIFDKYLRRIFEAGFVKKWLSDLMEPVLNIEISKQSKQQIQALMNLQKLYGAFMALFIGYFFSFIALAYEILHWHFTVEKHPFYDKYRKRIIYPKQNFIKQ